MMSSLWKNRNRANVTNKQTILKRPSSKRGNNSLSGLAQDQTNSEKRQIPHLCKRPVAIERISLFTFLRKKVGAGMTVEASVILPLFLFFFINLSSVIEMIRLHGNLELALWQTGNKMSVAGYILEDVLEEQTTHEQSDTILKNEIGDIAFSYSYVKGEVLDYLGEHYLESSPLAHGVNSLQFLESEIFTGDDCFEVVMTYPVAPWMRLEGVHPFRMVNRYYGHIWSGYSIPGAENGLSSQTVYIAENGEVYHENRDCTHLMLTIKEVAYCNVDMERNGSGGKYTRCELCARGITPESVYIGVEGDRYHYDRGCSGLKRTVFSAHLSEVEEYPPCSRCTVLRE